MTAKYHTIQIRMVDCIDRQLSGAEGTWVLNMKPAKLEQVRRFVLSFIVEGSDHTVPYATPDELVSPYPTVPKQTKADEVAELRADRVKLQGEIERLSHELAEAHATRPFPPEAREVKQDGRLFAPYGLPGKYREAGEIEALAQRLAKVEDRLALWSGAATGDHKALSQRINQVCDIIGNRIGGLVDRLDRIENPEGHRGDAPVQPGFPTGAGTTVEDAIAQVEEPDAESDTSPPRRGDRVRLEGARTVAGADVPGGWYGVVGSDEGAFQYVSTFGGLFWVKNNHPGLKEVRRGAANLPE